MNKAESFLQQAPTGVIITDADLLIRRWNLEMQRMSGHDEKSMLRRKLGEVVFWDIDPAAKKPLDFRQCFRSARAKIARTAYLQTARGGRLLVFLNARFVKTETAEQLMITVTDISHEISCSTISAAPLIVTGKESLQRIVGKDPKILELYRMIELAADSMANINIYGESGTGKELVANAIHQLSSRHNQAFVKVNCSALTETLLESELFGHVKGSFTGAYKDKEGRFEAASGGSIFLDEIAEISPMLQLKLLRVIQERVIERVGDNKPIKVDIRIITATNKDLRELVKKGLFREDLFYRLNVFSILTPPLRDRVNDLPLLVEHFIRNFGKSTAKPIKGLTEAAWRILMDYCWPGNVRELENAIEHAFVVCTKRMIDEGDLPRELRIAALRDDLCSGLRAGAVAPPALPASDTRLQQQVSFRLITREQLEQVLAMNTWHRGETARQLGVSTVALWKKMKKFGMLD